MVEEVSVDEFLKLPPAPVGRATKVDYSKVMKKILGKPMPVSMIGELMLKFSVGKEKVYASEVTRFLGTLPKKGYSVEFRTGPDNKRWVLVRRTTE